MPMIVIEKLCKGCAACVEVCPNKAISHLAKTAKIDQELCQDCEKCLSICPNGAITGAPRNGIDPRREDDLSWRSIRFDARIADRNLKNW